MTHNISEDMRHTMRLWACGVTVVTTHFGGLRSGMTASSFTSIALEPPLILVCLHKKAETCQMIGESRVFAVSLLGEDHEWLSSQFAGYTQLPEGEDRFHNVSLETKVTGSPILRDAIAWMDCKVYGIQDGFTHWIFVGEVLATERMEDPVWPLVYHNRAYRHFVK